jgi:hypothetical protein
MTCARIISASGAKCCEAHFAAAIAESLKSIPMSILMIVMLASGLGDPEVSPSVETCALRRQDAVGWPVMRYGITLTASL